MEDEMERLRAMLGTHLVVEESTNFDPAHIPEPAPLANVYLSSDPDDDEKVLSFEHRVGGRLEHAIGGVEGRNKTRIMVISC
jgi:hypothetical protein